MVTTQKGIRKARNPQGENLPPETPQTEPETPQTPQTEPKRPLVLTLLNDPVFLKAQLARLRKEGTAADTRKYTSQLSEMVSREIGQIQAVSGHFVKYLSIRVVRWNDAAPIFTALRLGKKIPVAPTPPSLPESPAN